ncbi:MAG TPA: HlyC/CorC family transporter [Clostridiaceae bacterium]|nr:HlyC/CorC family transporter [Clostridiaceae bacterium]
MDLWSFISLFILIALSAFFSGSEIAFASASKVRLRTASESGNRYAKMALYIYDHFEDALSTILIGNNLVNIAASSIATVIAVGLMGESGAVIATLVITVVVLIFGEISPKIVAKQNSHKITLLVSYPLRLLMFVLKPVVLVVVWIVSKISRLWEDGKEKEPSVTEEELVTLIESVKENGIIDEGYSDLLQSALEFSDITVQEILTPRTDMLAIDINEPLDVIIETVLKSPYSRIPVYDESIDNIIGILHVEHILKKLADTKDIDVRSLLIDAYFIHKTMKLPDVFSELKKRRLHMAIVTDEYGGTMGLITMEDVLEELVGDIWDESDEITNDFVRIDSNTFEVSGDVSIYDFLEYFVLESRDFESEYTTVGGWAIEMLDGFPNVNDSFEYENLIITITQLDGLRVASLTVTVTPKIPIDNSR